jgi:hypothetical protein
MTKPLSVEDQRRLAEAVKAACIRAAEQGFEQAAASGLCDEGALEAALGAVRMLDLDAVLAALPSREK